MVERCSDGAVDAEMGDAVVSGAGVDGSLLQPSQGCVEGRVVGRRTLSLYSLPPRAQSTETDLGTLKVRSKPATAARRTGWPLAPVTVEPGWASAQGAPVEGCSPRSKRAFAAASVTVAWDSYRYRQVLPEPLPGRIAGCSVVAGEVAGFDVGMAGGLQQVGDAGFGGEAGYGDGHDLLISVFQPRRAKIAASTSYRGACSRQNATPGPGRRVVACP